jgi:hypothetical protein
MQQIRYLDLLADEVAGGKRDGLDQPRPSVRYRPTPPG